MGVAAYGTYQSLLRASEYLSVSDLPTSAIIYPYLDDHLQRNVVSSRWRNRLIFGESSRDTFRLPFARIRSAGESVLETGMVSAHMPFAVEKYSSLAHLFFSYGREFSVLDPGEEREQQTAIALIKEFALLATRHQARFFVLDIFTPSMLNPNQPWREHLEAAGIPVIDCQIPLDDFTYKVPGDGHPNTKAHHYWADCLYRSLPDELR